MQPTSTPSRILLIILYVESDRPVCLPSFLFLVPSFIACVLPFFLPRFLLCFLPSFFLSFLPGYISAYLHACLPSCLSMCLLTYVYMYTYVDYVSKSIPNTNYHAFLPTCPTYYVYLRLLTQLRTYLPTYVPIYPSYRIHTGFIVVYIRTLPTYLTTYIHTNVPTYFFTLVYTGLLFPLAVCLPGSASSC